MSRARVPDVPGQVPDVPGFRTWLKTSGFIGIIVGPFYSDFIDKTMKCEEKLILSLGKNRISTIPRAVFSFGK